LSEFKVKLKPITNNS